MALFEGRHEDAKRILEDGIAADAAGGGYYAATKYMALAEAEIAAGDVAAALLAVSKGLELSSRDAQKVPAALMYIAAGELDMDLLATHVLPLDGIFEAFELMKSGESLRVVLRT